MPTPLHPAARAAVEAGRLAHLVTINPDGSPQVSLVWAGVEDDEIVIAHLGSGQKVRNIERDPRVAVSFEVEGRTEANLDHYLVVHGTARVTPGGGPELLQRLAERYIGPGVKFPPMDDPPPGNIIRIRPDRIAGPGPWND